MAAIINPAIPMTSLSEFIPPLEQQCSKRLEELGSAAAQLPRSSVKEIATQIALLCLLKATQDYLETHKQKYGAVGEMGLIGKKYFLPNPSMLKDPEVADTCVGILPMGHVGVYVINLGSATRIEINAPARRQAEDERFVEVDEMFDFRHQPGKIKLWPGTDFHQIEVITDLGRYTISRDIFPQKLRRGLYEEVSRFLMVDTLRQVREYLGSMGQSQWEEVTEKVLWRTRDFTKMIMKNPMHLKCTMERYWLKTAVEHYRSINAPDLQYTALEPSVDRDYKIAKTASKIYVLFLLQEALLAYPKAKISLIGRGYYLPKGILENNINYSRLCLGILNVSSLGPTLINLGGNNRVEIFNNEGRTSFNFHPGGGLRHEILESIKKIQIFEQFLNPVPGGEIRASDFPYKTTTRSVGSIDNSAARDLLKFFGRVESCALHYCDEKGMSSDITKAVTDVSSHTRAS